MVDVFISYKREERDRCERIYRKLTALGLDVWFDAHLTSGERFRREITTAVNAAKAVLVLWSPASVESDWVLDEAGVGQRRRVLVAAQLIPCDMPIGFGQTHYEKLHDEAFADHDESWLKILTRIGDLTARPKLWRFSQALGRARSMLDRWADENPDDLLSERMRVFAGRLEPADDHAAPPPMPIAASRPIPAPRPPAGPPHPAMASVPAGRFFMGSPTSELRRPAYYGCEEPRHLVRLNATFAMGTDPVTVDAFAEFIAETNRDMGDSAFVFADGKWAETKGRGWLNPGFAQNYDHPVTCVSWEDAKAYLNWLNARLGLIGRTDAYRLPSEAEWEYACRAGTQTPFSFGNTLSTEQANYDGNFAYGAGAATKIWRQGTTAVGTFPPNAFDLRDMHGNVWEWCEDRWHKTYSGAPSDGAVWMSGDDPRRVVRGGPWSDPPHDCRSASRYGSDPSSRLSVRGFRLARTLLPPSS